MKGLTVAKWLGAVGGGAGAGAGGAYLYMKRKESPKRKNTKKRKRGLRYLAAAGLLGTSGIALGRSPVFGRLIRRGALEMGHTTAAQVRGLKKAMGELYGETLKKRGVNPTIVADRSASATAHSDYKDGFPTKIVLHFPRLYSHQKKLGGVGTRPGVVGHEMGHAVALLKNPRWMRFLQRWDDILDGKYGGNEMATLSSGAAGASLGIIATKHSEMSPRTKRLLTGALIATPLLLKSPKLADEALASIRGLRILKKAGYSRKERAKEAGWLARAFSAHAREPLLVSAFPASVAIAIPSQPRNKRGSK